jgi:hypothetical protein
VKRRKNRDSGFVIRDSKHEPLTTDHKSRQFHVGQVVFLRHPKKSPLPPPDRDRPQQLLDCATLRNGKIEWSLAGWGCWLTEKQLRPLTRKERE